MMLTSLLVQVRRWLMQPHIWRFVGFASTVVALLCYALSSSFNHLFGDWKLWKICLYTVVSCIFCFAVLFAKVWHPSNSHWLKAHMAFLVLTVTSVYSFFYDKKVKGNPDAHGLISCAAFAVMSFSLSRQTHFGFEEDLVCIFLEALTVKLMKIKALLGIVGVCFSYSLIVLRCSLNAQLESGPEIQDQHHATAFIDIAQYFRTKFNQIARHVSCFDTFENFEPIYRNGACFVTLVSTVGGLFSFALSCSFNHLFGDWNLWKICVYCFLSFIFVAVLFAKVGQKPHIMQFIFLLQNLMRKNPEAYTFSFCVAIVLMSMHTSLPILEHVNARKRFSSSPLGLEIHGQHHVIVQVNSHSQAANCTDIAVIMPQLRACMESFKTNNRKLIDILSMHVGEYIEADDDLNNKDLIPIDNNLVIDTLQSEIVNDPSEVVKLMVTAGFEQECCHVYSSCRREFLEQFLIGLTLLPLDGRDLAKMDPMYLGFHVEIWTKSINIATRVLFPIEKRLCECFFSGFSSAADLAFMDVCRELTTSLLNFANCFAVDSSAPNLLPVVAEVFCTLHDLIPEFESLFSEPPNDSLRNEAINTCRRLEKATKGIFTEFENRICYDRAMADFLGGLYPISRDVMYFLGGASEARISLEKVFQENPLDADSEGTSSSFSMQIAKIMELLDSHLEVKSKNYNDPALHYFSMMNNGRYVEQRVKESSGLRNILGDDWIQKQAAKFQQNLEDYQRSSWDKVLGLLKLDENEPITAESMIENLKLFNMQFKETCRVQSTWFVLNEKLQEEIRNSLEKIVWPAYGNFTGRLQTILGSQADEYIEYSVSDIDALLNDLFRRSHWRISCWKRRVVESRLSPRI